MKFEVVTQFNGSFASVKIMHNLGWDIESFIREKVGTHTIDNITFDQNNVILTVPMSHSAEQIEREVEQARETVKSFIMEQKAKLAEANV